MLASLELPVSVPLVSRLEAMMNNLVRQADPLVNPYNYRRMRREVIEWISSEEWSHAATFAINRVVPPHTVVSMFKVFCLEMDRYKFGRKHVSDIATNERLQAFVTIEHPHSNIHMHAVLNLTDWLQRPVTKTDEHEFNKIWKKCTWGCGDLLIKELKNVRGWIEYITKEFSEPATDWMMASLYHRS